MKYARIGRMFFFLLVKGISGRTSSTTTAKSTHQWCTNKNIGFVPSSRSRRITNSMQLARTEQGLIGIPGQHRNIRDCLSYEMKSPLRIIDYRRTLFTCHKKDRACAIIRRGIQKSPTKLDMIKDGKLDYSIQQGIEVNIQELTQLIKDAHAKSDTDGILEIAPDLHKAKLSGDDMLSIALNAVSFNKGQAAGILNAYIASCRLINSHDDEHSNYAKPGLAWDTYTSWEEEADQIGLYPDLVTFCLIYSVMKDAIHLNDENKEFYEECAMQCLERAERYTKKITGSKRRKLLASLSRRKKENTNVLASDHIDQLRSNYGNDFDVLFENEDCVVVSKPSGMVCFHIRKTADGKIKKKKKPRTSKMKKMNDDDASVDGNDVGNKADISLEDALIDIGVTLSTLNPEALGIVHRIDRGTSGCIVLAKNNDAHARLVTNFFTRSANKSYTALLPYECEKEEHKMESSGVISLSVHGKSAISHYSVGPTFGTDAMLVNVETKTGRKHQVRVHCAEGLGRPIILDPLYSTTNTNLASTSKRGGDSKKKEHQNGQTSSLSNEERDFVNSIDLITLDPSIRQNGRFFLHASSLNIAEFDINVSSNLPQWWDDVLEKL